MTEYQPYLKWEQTWPGEAAEDFIAYDEDRNPIGRFYRYHTNLDWYWCLNAHDLPPKNGHCNGSAREACRMVEMAYWRATKG